MQPALTRHAQTRMQQRAISTDALECLLDFGCARHLHSKGRELVFFDKRARIQLLKIAPAVARKIGRIGKTYAVLGRDGTVITVGHRYKRISRE